MNIDKQNITVIIVTYKSIKYLSNLLDSMLEDSSHILEVRIVSNFTKESLLIKTLINSNKYKKLNIKLIENKINIGFGAACNLGARNVDTNYILFINPDTLIVEHSITMLLKHAIMNNSDIIGGICLNEKGDIHRTVVKQLTLIAGLFEVTNLGKLFSTSIGSKSFYDEDMLHTRVDSKVCGLSGAYILIKKESYYDLNGFDPNYFMYLEDVDICKRAIEKGMHITFCPHSKVIHVGGGSSNNKYKINLDAWFNSRSYYFRKNNSVISNLIIQPLFFIEEKLLKIREKYQ